MIPCSIKSTNRTPCLSQKNTCHDLVLRQCLFGFDFDGRKCVPPFHILLFWFRRDMRDPRFIYCNNLAQHVIAFFIVTSQESQRTIQSLFLWSSARSFGTRREHNFIKFKFSYTMVYSADTWGNSIDNVIIVNCLSSWSYWSTALTKSSVMTDGRPDRGWSWTFSRPSLNILTHFCTLPSVIMLGP